MRSLTHAPPKIPGCQRPNFTMPILSDMLGKSNGISQPARIPLAQWYALPTDHHDRKRLHAAPHARRTTPQRQDALTLRLPNHSTRQHQRQARHTGDEGTSRRAVRTSPAPHRTHDQCAGGATLAEGCTVSCRTTFGKIPARRSALDTHHTLADGRAQPKPIARNELRRHTRTHHHARPTPAWPPMAGAASH